MPVTPTSSLALWLERLRDFVAATEVFQARCNAVDDEAAARLHTYNDLVEVIDTDADELTRLRPFVVVCERQLVYRQFAEGIGPQLGLNGGLALWIEDNARHPDDHSDSKIDFANFAQGLADELADLTGEDDGAGGVYLPLATIELLSPCQRVERAARVPGRNDYWWAVYDVGFGVPE